MDSKDLRRALLPGLAVLALHFLFWKGVPVYRWWPTMDRVVHAAGGAAATWAVLVFLRSQGGERWFGQHSGAWRTRSESVVAFAALGLIVALWELMEWSLAQLQWIRAHRTDDETIADMALGMMGGLLLLVFLRRK